jgi:hypothetical protein
MGEAMIGEARIKAGRRSESFMVKGNGFRGETVFRKCQEVVLEE